MAVVDLGWFIASSQVKGPPTLHKEGKPLCIQAREYTDLVLNSNLPSTLYPFSKKKNRIQLSSLYNYMEPSIPFLRDVD